MTLVEGDQKDPFSIATTLRCREGHNSIPWITPLYPWPWPYNASSTIFWVFGITWPEIEPWSPEPLANTLLIGPIQLQIISGTELGCTSASYVPWNTDQVVCVLFSVDVDWGCLTQVLGKLSIYVLWLRRHSLDLRGLTPRLSPAAELGLSPGTWGTSFYGNAKKAQDIFGTAGHV